MNHQHNMKQIIITALTCVLALLPYTTEARQKRAHITMATYNLRYVNKKDSINGNGWEKDLAPEENPRLAVRKLKRISPTLRIC